MKRITMVLFMALLLAGCEYDDTALNDRLDGLEDRVDGADGDSLFSEIINGEEEVVIVLSDGRSFTFPKSSNDIFHRIGSVFPLDCNIGSSRSFLLNYEVGFHETHGLAAYMITPKEVVPEIAADWQPYQSMIVSGY